MLYFTQCTVNKNIYKHSTKRWPKAVAFFVRSRVQMVALHPGHARLLPEEKIQRNIKGKRHFQGMTLETDNICAFNLISNQIKRWLYVFQNVQGFCLFGQHSSTKNAFFHPQFWPPPSEYDEASPRRIFFAGIFHPPPSSASSQTQSIPEHTGGGRGGT